MRRTSRRELYQRLGLLKVVDPLTTEAYERDEGRIWTGDLDSSPHGAPWHTSLHSSSFPGRDERACPRKAMYGLMNIPSPTPFNRRSRMLMDGGKNLELELVRRWGRVGYLMTADQTAGDDFQTGFVDREVWLTGSPDAIVIPKRWRRGHVVEVKGKLHDKVVAMREGKASYDVQHALQLQAYIDRARESFHLTLPRVVLCEEEWLLSSGIVDGECRVHGGESCLIEIELEPVRDGSIYYLSLNDPGNYNHEFFFRHDPDLIADGREQLATWRDHFVAGELPESRENDGKRNSHPFGWKWSTLPCQYCDHKKNACRPDHADGIRRLADSHGVAFAQSVRPGYDYETTRQAVIDRWED